MNQEAQLSLINKWAIFADSKQHEKQVDLFADDMENVVFMPDGTTQTLSNKAELLDGITTALSAFQKTFHMNGQTEFDGNHATSYCIAHHVKSDGKLLVMYIRYEDDFVEVDGSVKFAKRELHIEIIEDRG